MSKLRDSRAPPHSWFGMHVWPHLDCIRTKPVHKLEPSLNLMFMGN